MLFFLVAVIYVPWIFLVCHVVSFFFDHFCRRDSHPLLAFVRPLPCSWMNTKATHLVNENQKRTLWRVKNKDVDLGTYRFTQLLAFLVLSLAFGLSPATTPMQRCGDVCLAPVPPLLGDQMSMVGSVEVRFQKDRSVRGFFASHDGLPVEILGALALKTNNCIN